MTRKIRLDQIDDVMREAVEDLVAATTLEWSARVKKATPVDTGRLRNSWQTDISFGVKLPPSWGGTYRTRQQTVPGFPELIGKELEQYARVEYQKIVRGI